MSPVVLLFKGTLTVVLKFFPPIIHEATAYKPWLLYLYPNKCEIIQQIFFNECILHTFECQTILDGILRTSTLQNYESLLENDDGKSRCMMFALSGAAVRLC